MTGRKRALRLLLGGVLLFVTVTSFSLVRHVLAHPGYGLQQNVATWARNKGMGTIVDWLESVMLNDPPAAAPASSLALADVPDSLPDTVPGTPAPTTTPPTTVPVTTSVPASTTTASTLPGGTTTTSSTTLPPPVDVAPVITPALRGEGRWRVLFTLGRSKRPVVWGTSMRPFDKYGSVVATAAVFDQTRLRAAMYNGPDIPGRGDWMNWEKVPATALRSLVAAFNGGFRFEHDPGGYVTEGVTVRKMKRGRATVGIDSSGTLHVGVWGEGMDSRGDWVSLRQNLPPLVQAGAPTWQEHKWTDWGTDFGDKKYTYRSGLCRRTDGSTMFVAANDVNIDLFARLMLLLGCDTGMQLDINGNWPHFSTYSGFGTRNRYGRPLDVRMGDPQRFVKGYEKDFFVLFDPRTLPDGAVG